MEMFIVYFILVTGLINLVHFCAYITGANIYDIQQIRKDSKRKQLARRRHTPLVSVLVPAHNEELTIVRTLDSIRTNTQRKIEIIVIDDASTDNTYRIVKDYIAQHPTRAIRIIRKRKNAGKGEALNTALRRYARGELIMTLDADSIIDRYAIKRAVAHFDDPRVVGMAANVRILDDESILGLVQKFEHMIGYRSKKFYSITNSEFIIGGVASTYRRSTISKVGFYDTDTVTEDIGLSLKVVSEGNKDQRIVYAADVAAMTEGVGSFSDLLKQRYRWKMGSVQNLIKHRALFANNADKYSRMLTWYRIPSAFMGEILLLLEPLSLLYILALSIRLDNPVLFVASYMTISLYILWNVWPDEHMKTSEKLRMTMYVPVMYFLLFIMNVVQIVAAVRCIRNANQVINRSGSTWVSPKRHAKPAA